MSPQTIQAISDFSIVIVVIGAGVSVYFMAFQKAKLRIGSRVVIALLAAASLLAFAGSRFLKWWPMTVFHVALAIWMTCQAFVYYRNRPATAAE